MTSKKPAINAPSDRPEALSEDLQGLLDAIPFQVMLVDSTHKIVAANRSLCQSLSLDLANVAKRNCFALMHGTDAPIPECPLVKALEEGPPAESEVFEDTSDKWMHWGIYAMDPLPHRSGPVYLHCIRDITLFHRTTSDLSQSLEHRKALGACLQRLQKCQTSQQIMEVLVDQVLSLSWLGVTATAAAFLVKGTRVEMVAHRNLGDIQHLRCKSLKLGECLCGQVAQTGKRVVCDSDSKDHHITFDDMQHHKHAILPLNYEDRVLGILNLYLSEGSHLDTYRMDFLEAAAAATAAVLAEQLAREETQQVRENLIESKQQLLENVIFTQENERKRVSRELHDQLGQSLLALMIKIQANGENGAISSELCTAIETQIQGIVEQVRQLAWELRPSILDDYGLDSALIRLVENLSAISRINVDYKYLGTEEQKGRLPEEIKIVLYRVAQEALSNVVRHSQGTSASVILNQQPNMITLLVEDDGIGFNPVSARKSSEKSLGLLGMEERVSSQRGTLIIESSANKGTTLQAQIPLEGETPQSDQKVAGE